MSKSLLPMLLLTFMCCSITKAQTHFQDYTIIPEAIKTVVFYDSFEKDNGNWVLEHDITVPAGDSTMSITDNSFIIQVYDTTIDEYCTDYVATQEFDFSKNFEIEVRIKVIWRDKYQTPWASIFWGDNVEVESGQDLSLHGYRHVHFNRYEERKNIDSVVIPLKEGMHDFGKYNTYTIRHYQDNYYLFINTSFLGKQKYHPLKGRLLGIEGCYKTFVKVDYIKFSYLPEEIEIR